MWRCLIYSSFSRPHAADAHRDNMCYHGYSPLTMTGPHSSRILLYQKVCYLEFYHAIKEQRSHV